MYALYSGHTVVSARANRNGIGRLLPRQEHELYTAEALDEVPRVRRRERVVSQAAPRRAGLTSGEA